MKVVRTLAIALVVLVIVGVGGLMVAKWWLVSNKLDPILESNAADVDRVWPTVQEDLETLGKHAFFTKARAGGDAGPTLNKLVGWEGQGLDREKGPLNERYKALPDEVRDLVKGDLKLDAELSESQAATLKALDFAWMQDLAQHGYWSLAGDSPFGRQSPVRVASAPMPNFLVLMRWSKLRLLRGVVDEDVASAVKDVQQLAWLSISTEQLVGAMIGVALARQTLLVAGPESGFTQLETERMKRLLFAAPGFTNWSVPTEARARFVKAASEHLPVARCIGWSEGGMSYLVKPFLEGRFADYYVELDALTPGGGCRFDLVAPIKAQSDKDPWSLMANEENTGELNGDETWVRLPIIKDIVGVLLASISAPNFFSKYADG